MPKNYTLTISVKRSPEEVYEAIKRVADWWIGEVKGTALKVGDTFTYRYKDFHQSQQKVTELVPGEKIVWHVEKANLSFAKKKDEWKKTDIIFDIATKGDRTEIKFTHRGLTPDVECFEACSGGWDFYLKKSLVSYLTKGKGLDPDF